MMKEQETFFAIAKVPLDNNVIQHIQILQTIYKLLTKSTNDCSRVGSHWETIGFQGNDPATDLRSVGMLGLLQLLYFIENYKQFVDDIYSLSRDEFQVRDGNLFVYSQYSLEFSILFSWFIYDQSHFGNYERRKANEDM